MSERLAERIASTLEFARESTPYWAARIPLLGATVWDALREIRPLPRETLQREHIRMVAAVGDTQTWRSIRSSGTTGVPVEVVLDGQARDAEARAFAGHLDRVVGGAWRGAPIVHLALHPEATSATWPSPFHPNVMASKWNLSLLWNAGDHARSLGLRRLDGAVVTVMPSVVQLLLQEYAGTSERRLTPRAIVLSGESVHDDVRSMVRTATNTIVTSHYALAEVGIAGVECALAGGYHAASELVFVEIDNDHHGAGEILLTTLANRAQPLIRYRTGDRGEWLPQRCGCGDSRPRFWVHSRRHGDTTRIDTIRLTKLFCQLGVEKFAVRDEDDGAVRVTVRPPGVMYAASRQLVSQAIAAAAAPGTTVRVDEEYAVGVGRTVAEFLQRTPTTATAIRDWLGMRLEGRADLVSAALIGSVLDPCARTRRSDIDAVVFIDNRSAIFAWVDLVRELRAELPGLSLHVDVADTLAERAPLLVARILDQHLMVAGRSVVEVLRPPTLDAVRAEARTFAQRMSAVLWERLTATRGIQQPLEESRWIARAALDALRFRFLLRGSTVLRLPAVLEAIAHDDELPPELVADIRSVMDVAREHCPPPLAESATTWAWLTAAAMCMRLIIS